MCTCPFEKRARVAPQGRAVVTETTPQHPGDNDDEITEFRPRSHFRLALEKREAEIGESPPKVNENGRSLVANARE